MSTTIPTTLPVRRPGRTTVMIARCLAALAALALLGAWITELTGNPLLGLGQQHLFYDSIALSLLAIVLFLDAGWHAQGI